MDALRLSGTDPAPAHAAEPYASSPARRSPASLLSIEPDHAFGWSDAAATGAPFYTAATADATERVGAEVRRAAAAGLLRIVATRAATAKHFCLGYDPARLARLVRAGDAATLRADLAALQHAQFAVAQGHHAPVVTIAAVSGDALGLGFELALAHDVVVAERGTSFGFPDLACGLFPIGGGPSFLIRRVGRAAAQPILLSGKLYSAEELRALDIVHVLAEPGGCEEAVREFVAKHARRFAMQRAVYAGRRRVRPLASKELSATADLWVRTAMALGPRELVTLDRLAESYAG